MLYNIILYRPVPIPSLPLQDSPSLGLLETPQVSYLVIIPIHQHKHDKNKFVFKKLIDSVFHVLSPRYYSFQSFKAYTESLTFLLLSSKIDK